MKSKFIFLLAFILTFLSNITLSLAQCAMCKATVEKGIESGESKIGAGLNSGILYLMSVPYIVFVVIGFLWYKNSKRNNAKTFGI